MKQPIETNGRHGVGVSTTASPDGGDIDDFSKYVDIETDPAQDEEQGRHARRKRGKVIGGLVVLATLVLAAGLFFWMTTGGKKKIDLPVRDRSAQTDQGTSRDAEDVTAQAIAEIRAASTSPTSASSPAPSTSTTPNASSAPVTIPLGGTVTTVEAAPATNAGQAAGTSSTQQSKPAGVVSERNPERSIRCAPVPKPVAALNQTTAAAPAPQTARGLPKALLLDAEKPVALPTFGAMRRAEGATAEFSSDIGASLNGLPPDSREDTVGPDWSSEERLPLFDRRAESSGRHIAGVTFGPAEQMPFDWDVDSSGGRESIDSLIDSLLPLPPSSGTKAVTGPPPAATESGDTDDDVNSTLGSLSLRDFGGNSGTWAISGGEAGE